MKGGSYLNSVASLDASRGDAPATSFTGDILSPNVNHDLESLSKEDMIAMLRQSREREAALLKQNAELQRTVDSNNSGERDNVRAQSLDMRYIAEVDEEEEHDFLFKLIVVGSLSVGKSCILLQFTDKRFSADQMSTIGVDFGSKIVTLQGGGPVKLQIWDTAGQEDFKAITRAYYREAAAALVVYDRTNPQSFVDVASWLSTVREGTANRELVVTLVGNKADLPAAITTEQGERFARDNGCLFFETSACTGQNIDEAFLGTASAVMRKVRSGLIDPANPCQGVRINLLKTEEHVRNSESFDSAEYGYQDGTSRRISLDDTMTRRRRKSKSGGGCC